VSWLVTLGRYEGWFALVAWAVVFLAMAEALVSRPAQFAPGAPPAKG
jgi:hypothetical protein